ncbi:MAG: CNNM domain-containing protein [Verrucomicrobiales bacterium]
MILEILSLQPMVLVGLLATTLAVTSALFSAMETSLAALGPFELQKIQGQDGRLAPVIELLSNRPQHVLSVVLLADLLCNIPLIMMGLYLTLEAGWSWWAAVLLVVLVLVVPCELVPKAIAHAQSQALARRFLHILGVLVRVIGPFSGWLERWQPSLDVEPSAGHLSDEELQALIAIREEEGVLHEGEATMIRQVLALEELAARDFVTPRVDVFAVDVDWSEEKIREEVTARRLRRVPVYHGSIDEVVGVLDVQAYLASENSDFVRWVTLPSFVPESLPASHLLRGLLQPPRRLAVVLDEFGGMVGITSLTDMAEFIQADAVMPTSTPLYVEKVEGGLLVSGSARLGDVARYLPKPFDVPPDWTMHEFIVDWLGRIPRTGVRFPVRHGLIHVRRTNRRRVREVFIELNNNQNLGEE